MVGKFVQICLAGALSYVVYYSLNTLSRLWANAPAEVPEWVTLLSHYLPWVLFVFLAITILRI